VNEQLSVIDLILHASLVVQLVMLLLAGASVVSWAIIFRKRKLIGNARAEADRFESWFWSGVDLGKLFKSIEGRGGAAPGMEGIFHAGFSEYSRVRGQGGQGGQGAPAPAQSLEGVRRAMHVEQLKEIDQLEESLATLATIGSTSPYVGLFGTVWGIMSAFHGLGNVQQATLAMVAPGIAEALIATAMGLFAAIPAVIGYNRFADRVSRLELRYDTFVEEFVALLERHSGPRGA
jgi:biopolymer transport protein TolQ